MPDSQKPSAQPEIQTPTISEPSEPLEAPVSPEEPSGSLPSTAQQSPLRPQNPDLVSKERAAVARMKEPQTPLERYQESFTKNIRHIQIYKGDLL